MPDQNSAISVAILDVSPPFLKIKGNFFCSGAFGVLCLLSKQSIPYL